MAKSKHFPQVYHFIMEHMIATGKAPDYTEVSAEIGVTSEEGRKVTRKLFSTMGFPGWFSPGTDEIASFAPFNNIPANYRLTIDDEQKWFAQWAFESLAVCWLFPGKTVQIDSICLDCQNSITVKVKDGEIESQEPEGLIGHVSVPIGKWMANIAYSWSAMNFFRSEEHLRDWDGFTEKNAGGIISLDDLMKLFSGSYFKNRRDPGYFLKMGEYFGETITTLGTLESAGSFWRLKWFEKLGFSLAVKLGLI